MGFNSGFKGLKYNETDHENNEYHLLNVSAPRCHLQEIYEQ